VKKSWILYLLCAFFVWITIADVFGVAPLKSIWSNFERMEGLVTMLHLGALFIVMSSVFKEADWKKWWNTSLAASFIMVLYCALQILGVKTINQGGVRVDGTFGNAIYLAVYMLFHIFIALLYMFRSWKNVVNRWIYGALILCQLIVLYYTATRGAILGLIGGLIIFAFLNLRNREDRMVRKFSIAIIAGTVLLIGGFFAVRNASFVQKSPVLSRFATLSLSDLQSQGRYYIWPMALKGIAERPILGWGQDNFGYVFQEHYNPAMFNLEPWFDRAHNVFLDWAIAGGVPAFLLYFALYIILLYCIWKKANFPYLEKTLLTALVAAYFFHNLFVFDHLFSYMLFFALLAYVHERSASDSLWTLEMKESTVRNFITPGAVIALALVFYFANWKPLEANISLISGLKDIQQGQVVSATKDFKDAYNDSPLGRQEESEQIVTYAPQILGGNTPIADRNTYYELAKTMAQDEVNTFPKDVRQLLITGLFFVQTGNNDAGIQYLLKARALAPNKQEIYFQIAGAYISKGDMASALTYLKQAYDLSPTYTRAKVLYLVGAVYAGDRNLENQLKTHFGESEFNFDDTILSAYYSQKRITDVVAIFETRKRLDPANASQYDQYIVQAQSGNLK
jgi:O-antigen ligase